MLASGRTRWLATAAKEVEWCSRSIRETELLRAWPPTRRPPRSGMAANPSLRALAEAVDEPWRSILLDHREAFVQYSREIMGSPPRTGAAHDRAAGGPRHLPRR